MPASPSSPQSIHTHHHTNHPHAFIAQGRVRLFVRSFVRSLVPFLFFLISFQCRSFSSVSLFLFFFLFVLCIHTHHDINHSHEFAWSLRWRRWCRFASWHFFSWQFDPHRAVLASLNIWRWLFLFYLDPLFMRPARSSDLKSTIRCVCFCVGINVKLHGRAWD